MYKSRRVVVRNENRSGRGEGSEKWKVKSEEWRVKSEQRSVNRGQWSLIIDHWSLILAWYGFVYVCRRGDLQIAHITIRLCYNSPTFQIHPHSKFTHVSNSPTLQFAHIFNCPHVGGRIAIRPYTCVFWTFANIHVNTQKTSWAWYGFLCVCRRGKVRELAQRSMWCNSPIQRALFPGSKNC